MKEIKNERSRAVYVCEELPAHGCTVPTVSRLVVVKALGMHGVRQRHPDAIKNYREYQREVATSENLTESQWTVKLLFSVPVEVS